ncbi:MAG TPA: SWIM zinc finger family protein [Gemmatimonadaceae bacterium]|nr:SWIM zinc finger family protein [Gemmatimonadaceae bacterium]
MVWGECQGSGAKPYQTRADLRAEPAFKCSCPSRKFPCKHSLGLLLLLAADEKIFRVGAPPAWVAEWIESREERAEKQATRKEREATAEQSVDPAARAKRAAARADKISAGMVELDLWLRDVVRGGIAGVESRGYGFSDEMAARLVDAQAPGAARLVRTLAWLPSTGEGWHSRFVAQLGRLHLLTSAWSRVECLPAESQADVRTHLGWATTENDLADLPGVADNWMVLGQIIEEDERLRVRRTWVHGANTQRMALLLHFAPGTAPFAELLPSLGDWLGAELVFYPGSHPQRAAIRARHQQPAPAPRPSGERRLEAAVAAFARALSRDPWIERIPLLLESVVPEYASNRWLVRDEEGRAVPVAPRFRNGWTLLAISGGHPVWLSGEWSGGYFLPLAAAHGDKLVSLAT